MRRWKLRKWDFVGQPERLSVSREWEIQADRIETEGHTVLRAYRRVEVPDRSDGMKKDQLVYVCRDWDEVTLVEDGQDV